MVGSMKRMIMICLLLAALLLSACSGVPAAAAPTDEPAPTEEAPAPTASSIPTDKPAAPETPSAADEPAELREVEAATVDELLKAIAPNTVIKLTGRSYNLRDALGYGNFGGDCYDWESGYDGWELVISGVSGLTIKADRQGTEIVTEPRYAAVLHFVDCTDITLEGFTAGHSDGAGMCTGSVLYFSNCSDVQVSDCDLYGCGTYALELFNCRNVGVDGCILRDCTNGAASVINTNSFVVNDCTVYGIRNYNGCFWYSGSSGCAVLNSLIRSCSGQTLIWSEFSQVFLGGCEVRGNEFDAMFFSSLNPITVEGCSFKSNSTNGWYFDQWSKSERAVNREGKTWDDAGLFGMQLENGVSWEPPVPEAPDVEPIEPSADGMIHVHNVDELLASIAPGVSIYLEDGVYSLADAVGYGSYSGEYYSWMACYDGPGLVIRNVKDLTITAAGPHRASITAEPRYADVLSFENCASITLQNFTAGHTTEPSICMGGVLGFLDSENVEIRDCSLYGCGVLGVSAYGCRNMNISYTEVHHCSYGAFSFNDCRNVTMEHCNIHDVPDFAYQVFDCKNITADGKAVPEGESW